MQGTRYALRSRVHHSETWNGHNDNVIVPTTTRKAKIGVIPHIESSLHFEHRFSSDIEKQDQLICSAARCWRKCAEGSAGLV